MRRRALVLAAVGLVLAGCSGGKTVSPTPQTVQGKLPKAPKVTGNAPAKVLLGQATNWRTAPPTIKWTKAESAQRPLLEKVYLGQAKPKDAMDELAKQINAIPD